MEDTKIIEITDPQAGTVKETTIEGSRVMESLGFKGARSLREVATTSEFPTLLRVGLKQILFD